MYACEIPSTLSAVDTGCRRCTAAQLVKLIVNDVFAVVSAVNDET